MLEYHCNIKRGEKKKVILCLYYYLFVLLFIYLFFIIFSFFVSLFVVFSFFVSLFSLFYMFIICFSSILSCIICFIIYSFCLFSTVCHSLCSNTCFPSLSCTTGFILFYYFYYLLLLLLFLLYFTSIILCIIILLLMISYLYVFWLNFMYVNTHVYYKVVSPSDPIQYTDQWPYLIQTSCLLVLKWFIRIVCILMFLQIFI